MKEKQCSSVKISDSRRNILRDCNVGVARKAASEVQQRGLSKEWGDGD